MGPETDIKQRTPEWHKQRSGRFTASTATALLGIKGLGATGETVALGKAIEEFSGICEEGFCSYDMQVGKDREPFAFKKYKELNPFSEVLECGFFEFGEHCGASPDGLIDSDSVLEIKCPKMETFFKLVATNEVDKNHYAQMQVQMLATNRTRAVYFNYYIFEGIEYWHEIEVARDEAFLSNYKNRLLEAIEIKKYWIKKLQLNKQF